MGQMIIVESEKLDRLLDEIAGLRHEIRSAKITPRKEWLTVAEYADTIGRSVRTVLRKIAGGELETKIVAGVKLVRAP